MARLLIISFLLCLFGLRCVADDMLLPSTFEGLKPLIDKSLDRFPSLVEDRRAQVDSMKKVLATTKTSAGRLSLMRDIITEYETLNLDSMIVVCGRAISLAEQSGDAVTRQWAVLTRASGYPVTGVVSEALNDVRGEMEKGIFPQNRGRAFSAMAKIHFGAVALYGATTDSSSHFAEGGRFVDSLMTCHYSWSPINSLLSGVKYDINGDKERARAAYTEVVRSRSADAYEISRAALLLSRLLKDKGRTDDATYYLGLASLYDLNRGDMVGPALSFLGFDMLDRGESELGRKYLAYAFSNSSAAGDIARASHFLREYPDAIDDYFSYTHEREWRYIMALVAVALALTGVVFSRWRLCRRLRAERLRSDALVRANDARDEAIGNFLEITAGEQEHQEDFNRVARRKIAAGQLDDLASLLRRPVGEGAQAERFAAFDRGFARICPDFAEQVNALLLPDKQVVTPSPTELTPELRVLAFSRLGIDDAITVARFLGLSLNTVYTYRNKLRSRAISRDSFDSDVVAIGRIA